MSFFPGTQQGQTAPEDAITPAESPNQPLQVSQRPGFFPGSQAYQPEQSLFDVTAGAFEYGAADTARALSARVARFSNENFGGYGASPFQDTADSLKQFIQDHPQYAPTQIQNAWDLVSNPKAIVSHFSAGAPFMLAIGAVREVPYAGIPLQAGLAYAVESQNAYESAVASGADVQTAGRIGNIVGVLNAGLQMAQVNRIFKIPYLTFGEAGVGIVQEALQNTLTASNVLKLSGAATKNFSIIALENALQGAVRETVPSQIEGKTIPSGFLERRIGEALDAGIAGEVFGIARNAKDVAFGKVPATTPQGNPASGELDVFSRKDLETKFTTDFNLSENRVDDNLGIADAYAKTWAKRNNKSLLDFYPNYLTFDTESQDLGETLYQGDRWARKATLDNTKGFFSKMKQAIQEELGGRNEVTVQELEGFLRSSQRGIKADEVEWTGRGNAIRSVNPNARGTTKWKVQDVLQMADRQEVMLHTYTKSEAAQKVVQTQYDDIVDQQAAAEKAAVVALQKAKTLQEQ